MPYRNPFGFEKIHWYVLDDGTAYSDQFFKDSPKNVGHNGHCETTMCGNVYTVIPADGTIAGYLPAPKDASADYAIKGTSADGKSVIIAECHHEDITPGLNRFKQVVPEIESLLNEYILMYDDLYDADGTDNPLYTSADVDAADAWGRENAYFVGRLCDYRQDYFSSDREIVALYFAMSCEPGVRKAQPKPAPKPAAKQTSRKNAKPASRTLKFPFAKDLIIDGENVGKCTEIQEYEKVYSFVTYNGVYQCRKNDKIQSNGFEIKITTTK